MAGKDSPVLEKTSFFIAACIVGALFLVGGIVALMKRSRSLRHNNPGSLGDNGIDWKGLADPRNDAATNPRDPQLIFISAPYGIRAMVSDVGHDIVRHQDKLGQATVASLITEYAPPNDPAKNFFHGNDTPTYIRRVAARLKVPANAPLNLKAHLVPLVYAITQNENSTELDAAYPADQVAEGLAMGIEHLKSKGFDV